MTWLLPPVLVVFCLIAMVAMDQLSPFRDVITHPWRLSGIAIGAFGLLADLSSAVRFLRLKTNIVPFRDPDSVVVSGLFAYTRNPMYLGYLLILLGAAVYLGSLLPFLMVLVFFVAADRWYIPDEERRLEKLFGDEYAAYRRRVRRWL